MKLFPKVSKLWYLNLYPDVKKANLVPKKHYILYGIKEGRYPNIFRFLSQKNSISKFTLRNNLIHILFILINVLTQKSIKLNLMSLIVALQVKELNRYKIDTLLLTSWLKDGVEEAIKLYIKLQSTKSTVALLKGVKDGVNTPSSPMILEIWKHNKLVFSMGVLYPVDTFFSLNKKQNLHLNLHIHHAFQIEYNVSQFLRIASGRKFFYLHDYYIFTSNWHLYLENSLRRDLAYFFKFFPNNLMDLNYLIENIDLFVCPSKNVYSNCRKYLPGSKLYWAYPPETANLELVRVEKVRPKSIYNILIIANLGMYKGRSITNSVIEYCEKRSLPFNFIHFGRGPLDNSYSNYTHYEGFDRQNMLTFCSELDLDFAFLPFQAEETYSFTLSDIMFLGLPLVTTAVGAIPERCQGRRNTILVSKDSETKDIIKVFESITVIASKIKSKKVDKVQLQRFSRNKSLYFFL